MRLPLFLFFLSISASGLAQVEVFPRLGRAASQTTVGTVAGTWQGINNVLAQDGNEATVELSFAGRSDFLNVQDFDFNLPAGAVINSIRVDVRRRTNVLADPVQDNDVQLLKGGVPVGDNRAQTGVNWPTTAATVTYGGADTWGETWDAKDINDQTFGVRLRVVRPTGGGGVPTAAVDFVLIGLNYTDGVLPVTLTAFSAINLNDGTQLTWTTAQETNSDFFEVQRSANGTDYRPLGSVRAAGESTQEQRYAFTDPAPAAGVHYYRLRQVDFDGREEFFGPVVVRTVPRDAGVYPTSLVAGQAMQFSTALDQPSEVWLVSLRGEAVVLSLPAGSRHLTLLDVTAGVYAYRWLSAGEEIATGRVLVR